MGVHTFSREDYLKAAQIFHWAKREHYQLWFTGSLARHRRTEVMLPRLVKRGKLIAVKYGSRYIYSAPRRRNSLIEHGLACTEGLVRIWRSKMNGVIIPEKYFRGLGSVPEWGILYPQGMLLLFEYCTQNNFEQAFVVKRKIAKYRVTLPTLVRNFVADDGFVLFVIGISRERVENFVSRNCPGESFFFTDYETFTSIEIGQQLKTPIYIWGEDGKNYGLSK